VNRIIMRPEKETPHDIKVTVVNDPAVLCDECLPMFSIAAGDTVPWQIRMLVMDDMKIVEEKKQPKERGIFNDCGSLRDRLIRTMFGK
jgi:hypothetical protein